jgi:hypothetical protein
MEVVYPQGGDSLACCLFSAIAVSGNEGKKSALRIENEWAAETVIGWPDLWLQVCARMSQNSGAVALVGMNSCALATIIKASFLLSLQFL